MEPRPYTINGSLDRKSTVVRLFYGDKKYVVVKCKNEFNSLKGVEKQLAAYLRGGKENPGSLYLHLFRYVKNTPNLKFRAELVLESESGYELLKAEQLELEKGRKNKNCLSNAVNAYISVFDPDTKMYGWLTQNEVMNFQKWMKGRKKKASA